MPTTPTWGIPYATVGDSPNGPAQEQAIALAVDAAITSALNTAQAGTATKGNAARLVAEAKLTTDSAAFTGTDILVWQLAFNSLGPAQRYRVELSSTFYTSNTGAEANLEVHFRWKQSGTITSADTYLGGKQMTVVRNFQTNLYRDDYMLIGAAAGSTQVGITCKTTNGINCQMAGNAANVRTLRVWDEGV